MKSYLNLCVLLFGLNFFVSFLEGSSFRCDYRYSSVAKGWFKRFDVPVTWFDARERCALEGAVLASPSTLKIRAEMTGFLKFTDNEETVYEIFTGIHATIAQGDYHSLEGAPLSVIPHIWAPNEPDNKDNKENCLTLNSLGQLADVSCNETRPFICHRSESTKLHISVCGTVDPEYRLNKRTNKCYKFHTNPKKFSKAFLVCSAEGGHLAIINSDIESTVLKELFAEHPENSLKGNFLKHVAFIGFSDWADHSEWRTIHGKSLTEAGYDTFAPGNPDNNSNDQYCGAIFRSGHLDDMSCGRETAFICEKSPDYNAACSPPSH